MSAFADARVSFIKLCRNCGRVETNREGTITEFGSKCMHAIR